MHREWIVPSDPDSIRIVRAGVAEYAREKGLGAGAVGRIKLAVSEIVTNAIVHAYPGRAAGTITVRAEADNRLAITVTDHGGGFRRRDDSPGVGLGLPLVRHLAATLEVGTPAGGKGTEIRMTFPIPSPT